MRQKDLYETAKFQHVDWNPSLCSSALPSFWYDFSNLSTITLDSSGNLQTVQDSFKSDNLATQATSGQRPIYYLNGNVGSKGLSCAEVPGWTTLRNIRTSTSKAFQDCYIVTNLGEGTLTTTSVNSSYLINTASSGIYLRIISTAWNGITGSVYRNGSEVADTVGTTNVLPMPNTLIRWTLATQTTNRFYLLGSTTFATRNWNGAMMEIVAFQTVLNNDERYKVEGYLAHKWNLADRLRAGHPYIARPPTC